MREIKFRAWDKDKMVEFMLLDIADESVEYIDISGWIKEEALMQYTGLKDKNGTEIYEGDIMVVRELHDGDTHVWNQSTGLAIPFLIKWDDEVKGFDLPARVAYSPNHYEIIGDIYENPELVEKE